MAQPTCSWETVKASLGPDALQAAFDFEWVLPCWDALPDRVESQLFGHPCAPWRLLLLPRGAARDALAHTKHQPRPISVYLDAPKAHTVVGGMVQAAEFSIALCHPSDASRNLTRSSCHAFSYPEFDWGWANFCSDRGWLRTNEFLGPTECGIKLRVEGTALIAGAQLMGLESTVVVPGNSAAAMLAPMHPETGCFCDLQLTADNANPWEGARASKQQHDGKPHQHASNERQPTSRHEASTSAALVAPPSCSIAPGSHTHAAACPSPEHHPPVACHRVVMAAASPVLRAMLTGHWREAQCARLSLHGLSRKVLRTLVDWVYSADSLVPVHTLVPLWAVADQYSLQGLCAAVEGCLAGLLDSHPNLALHLYASARAATPQNSHVSEVINAALHRHLPLCTAQPEFVHVNWGHVAHVLAVAWDRATAVAGLPNTKHEQELLGVLNGVQTWLEARLPSAVTTGYGTALPDAPPTGPQRVTSQQAAEARTPHPREPSPRQPSPHGPPLRDPCARELSARASAHAHAAPSGPLAAARRGWLRAVSESTSGQPTSNPGRPDAVCGPPTAQWQPTPLQGLRLTARGARRCMRGLLRVVDMSALHVGPGLASYVRHHPVTLATTVLRTLAHLPPDVVIHAVEEGCWPDRVAALDASSATPNRCGSALGHTADVASPAGPLTAPASHAPTHASRADQLQQPPHVTFPTWSPPCGQLLAPWDDAGARHITDPWSHAYVQGTHLACQLVRRATDDLAALRREAAEAGCAAGDEQYTGPRAHKCAQPGHGTMGSTCIPTPGGTTTSSDHSTSPVSATTTSTTSSTTGGIESAGTAPVGPPVTTTSGANPSPQRTVAQHTPPSRWAHWGSSESDSNDSLSDSVSDSSDRDGSEAPVEKEEQDQGEQDSRRWDAAVEPEVERHTGEAACAVRCGAGCATSAHVSHPCESHSTLGTPSVAPHTPPAPALATTAPRGPPDQPTRHPGPQTDGFGVGGTTIITTTTTATAEAQPSSLPSVAAGQLTASHTGTPVPARPLGSSMPAGPPPPGRVLSPTGGQSARAPPPAPCVQQAGHAVQAGQAVQAGHAVHGGRSGGMAHGSPRHTGSLASAHVAYGRGQAVLAGRSAGHPGGYQAHGPHQAPAAVAAALPSPPHPSPRYPPAVLSSPHSQGTHALAPARASPTAVNLNSAHGPRDGGGGASPGGGHGAGSSSGGGVGVFCGAGGTTFVRAPRPASGVRVPPAYVSASGGLGTGYRPLERAACSSRPLGSGAGSNSTLLHRGSRHHPASG